MNQYLQNKKGKVQSVFNKVYDKYDLMNDFMSIGIHRLWKKDMINWMAPYPKKKLIDMACGTGAQVFYLTSLGYEVVGSDFSPALIEIARKKMLKEKKRDPDCLC